MLIRRRTHERRVEDLISLHHRQVVELTELHDKALAARDIALRNELFSGLATAVGARQALRICEALGWVEDARLDGTEVHLTWRRSVP